MIFFKAKKMHEAVKAGDVEKVRALLDAGVSPDIYSDRYSTLPLQRAVEANRIETARVLIQGGATLSFDNSWRSVPHTLFSSAASHGHFGLADMLLKADPDFLNRRDYCGYTPLARMSEAGNLEAIKYLLKKNADTAIKTNDNRTAYFLAQKEGRQDVMDLLAPYYAPPAAKEAALRSIEEGWKKLADDRIASVTVEKDIGYRITEIFNFAARERRTICLNIETGNEIIETRGFDDMSNKALLEEALAELQKRGGTADPASISGIYKALPRFK